MGPWRWIALLAGLLLAAVLLAWADSTLFRSLFPQPFPALRRGGIRGGVMPAFPGALGQAEEGRPAFVFAGLGSVGGFFTFWWFLATGAGGILLALSVLALVPARARRAAQRLSPAELPVMMAAGIAVILLAVAVTVLMRVTFVLLPLAPVVLAGVATGVLFGVAVLALAVGRGLGARLGPAPVLIPALAALLLFFDLALVPFLGWLALLVLAVTGLGVAALTRLGSAVGWGLEDLRR